VTIGRASHYLGAVLAHTRVRLLEINVHSDGLNIVQRVLLIEWQAEISLELHLRARHMLINSTWLVLARSHIDTRV
jgi:hypothetical protein